MVHKRLKIPSGKTRKPYFLALVVIVLVVVLCLAWAWRIEISQRVTCTASVSQSDRVTGYLEIQLKEQHPIEPTFNAGVYLYSLEERDFGLTSTTLLRSTSRTYGPSIVEIPLAFDAVSRAVHARGMQSLDLVAERGLHRFFPFDSGTFNFSITTTPPLHYNAVRITNRVPGFTCDCSQLVVERSSENAITVRFKLQRSLLIQTFTLVLCVASIIFAVAIIILPVEQPLAITTASFFFSVWSLRQIVSSSMHVFPTLFDLFILTICTLLVVALCWRVVADRRRKRDKD